MGSSRIAAGDSGGMRGSVLSGGPRPEIDLTREGPAAQQLRALGPASLWWAPWVGDTSIRAGAFLPGGGGLANPSQVQTFRCSPVLVAYPRPHRGPQRGSVYYAVLGGRAHLNPDDSWRNDGGEGAGAFRPAPDLAFTLGVELPAEMARRLGHGAAATGVRRGAPGHCRGPRLVSLVGSRPRLALSSLGQQLLSWKEFPPCPFENRS